MARATMELNVPQRARWAVSNRRNIQSIQVLTGTSITTELHRPDQEATTGEATLSLLIEGDTETAVQSALFEIQGLLREATTANATGQQDMVP